MTATGISSEPARERRGHTAQERRPEAYDRPALGVPPDSDAVRHRLGSRRVGITGGVPGGRPPGTGS